MRGLGKEKIFLALTVVVLLLSYKQMEKWATERVLSPQGGDLEERTLTLSKPVFLQPEEVVWEEGGRNIFSEPGELMPLDPLELEPPPLPPLPAIFPSPRPMPEPAFWRFFRRPLPKGAVQEEESAPEGEKGGAPEEKAKEAGEGEVEKSAAGEEVLEGALKREEGKELQKGSSLVYDSFMDKNGLLHFGRILNPDPLQVLGQPYQQEENKYLLKEGETLRFQKLDPKSGKKRGFFSFDSSRVEFLSLAGTVDNLYALRRRIIPEGDYLAHLKLARWCREEGAHDHAITEYLEVLRLREDLLDAYLELGREYGMECRWNDEIRLYLEAIRRGVQKPIVHLLLGNLYRKFSLWSEALEEYKKAIERQSSYVPAYLKQGEIYLEMGCVKDALKYFNRVVSLEPGTSFDRAWAFCGKGECFLAQGLLREAEESFRNAFVVELSEETGEEKKAMLAEALNGLGAVLLCKGDLEGALGEFQKAVESAPDLSLAYSNMGLCLVLLGRWPEAEENLAKAVELDPLNHKLPALIRGTMREAEGKFDEAEEFFRQAVEFEPHCALPHYFLGRLLRRMGDLNSALEEMTSALKLAPEFVEALIESAQVHSLLGDFKTAEAFLLKVLKTEPDSLPLRNHLTGIYIRSGRLNLALEEIEGTLKRDSEDTYALLGRGYLLYRMGQPLKAIDSFSTALELLKTSPQDERLAYASGNLESIQEHRKKWLWIDDFSGERFGEVWEKKYRRGGVVPRVLEGKLIFSGTEVQEKDEWTGLWRTLPGVEFESLAVDMEAERKTRAYSGIALQVFRRNSVFGGIALAKDSKDRMAYRVWDSGKDLNWQALEGFSWGGRGNLAVEKVDAREGTFRLVLDGEELKRIKVSSLKSTRESFFLSVFGSANTGVHWSFSVDSIRMVIRKE